LIENVPDGDNPPPCSSNGDHQPVNSETIRFYNAFNPNLVLSTDTSAEKLEINRDDYLSKFKSQNYDLMLEYRCGLSDTGDNGEWFIFMSDLPSIFPIEFFNVSLGED